MAGLGRARQGMAWLGRAGQGKARIYILIKEEGRMGIEQKIQPMPNEIFRQVQRYALFVEAPRYEPRYQRDAYLSTMRYLIIKWYLGQQEEVKEIVKMFAPTQYELEHPEVTKWVQ